jgi:hypothetical protein
VFGLISAQWWIALGLALAGAVSGWTLNDWRWKAKETDRAQQALADERRNAAATIRRVENVLAAQAAAVQREHVLRMDAAASRDALDGLRTATSTALSAAANNHAACLERADTFAELFTESAREYRNMAEKADRHASDAAMMQQAWPR